MKLIKISPKFQVTIPQHLRHLCGTNWLSISANSRVITLRSVEIQEAKTDQEILDELIKECL